MLSDDSSALRDLELALNLKIATMDIGSDSLSTAFTMSCSFSLAGNRVLDFPPLMLILLLTLPMPTMYIDAPALVLTTTRCFSNRVVCPVGAITIVDGKSQIDPEKCIKCHTCEGICPVEAIKIEE